MKSFSKISLYVFVVISLFSLPLITLADKYTPLVEIPGLTSGANTNADIGPYVSGLYRWVISISIAIAVVMFTFHAFGYLLSESTVTSKSKAKEGMVNVIIGLVLIFSAFLILKTINPQLINLSFTTTLPQDNSMTGVSPTYTTCKGSAPPLPTTPGLYIQVSEQCKNSGGTSIGYTLSYRPYTATTDLGTCKAAAAALPLKDQPAVCLLISNLNKIHVTLNLTHRVAPPSPADPFRQEVKYFPTSINNGFNSKAACDAALAGTGPGGSEYANWKTQECNYWLNDPSQRNSAGPYYKACSISSAFCTEAGGQTGPTY